MTEDTDYLAEGARHDPSGFAALYDRVAPALYAWAELRVRGRLRRAVDPDDLVQEVWWRAMDGFPRFEQRDRGAFRAWIFAIATNVYRSWIRQRSPTASGLRREEDSLPAELRAQLTSITTELKRRDDVSTLVRHVAGLPIDDRRLLLHCGLEQLTAREAAPILGVAPEAVKKRWQRLRADLERNPRWRELLAG